MGASGPLLVQAMLETGQTDQALEILTDERGGIDSVPAELVSMVANKAAATIASIVPKPALIAESSRGR